MNRARNILLALALVAQAALAATSPPAKPAVKILPVPPVGPSPITPDCRCLFVVDTSSTMQRYADGLYRTTHRLVANGLGGRMQEGDIFTVWTYADTVLTREFPLNAWTPDLNIALANRAYEFLAKQKFRGKSNLRPVFAELGQALAIATNLTIVLISDGTDVIVGTPFDRAINVTYGKRASEMRTARMPFITSLVTQRGEFTHWAVRGGLEDIGLPLPEKPAVPVPLLAQQPAVVTPTPNPTLPPIPVVTAPPSLLPAVSTPKPAVPTNPPPAMVATAPAPTLPKPAPVPKPVETPSVVTKPAPPDAAGTNRTAARPPETPAPKATPTTPAPAPAPAPKTATNAVATTTPVPPPVIPKPSESSSAVAATKKVESVPTVPPQKPDANLLAPASKQEAKAASAPSPKPVVETPKAPAPAPQPVAKAKEELVTPAIPSAIRQPKSVVDASNALAKVELLRPPVGTSAPPAKPLEARTVEPKPTPPATKVILAETAKPNTSGPTNPPVATNMAAVTAPPKPIAIVVPPTRTTSAPPRVATAPAASSKLVPVTNTPAAKTNTAAAIANITPASAPPKARPEASAPKPAPVVARPASTAEVPKPMKPEGQLAVATPQIRRGNWIYLAAAVGLLVLAGGIIAHLLRPRPTPSVISQSLDDKRL